MRRTTLFQAVAAMLVLGHSAPASWAGEILPGSPRAALAQTLIAREKAAWEFYRRKDKASLLAMTSEDFADLYSGGEVVDRKRWLADMEVLTVERSELSPMHVFELSNDVIMLTYEGKAWGHAADGRPLFNDAAVTSVWARRKGRWVNVFYGEAALTPDSAFSSDKAH